VVGAQLPLLGHTRTYQPDIRDRGGHDRNHRRRMPSTSPRQRSPPAGGGGPRDPGPTRSRAGRLIGVGLPSRDDRRGSDDPPGPHPTQPRADRGEPATAPPTRSCTRRLANLG
jgi:hypothetical protein